MLQVISLFVLNSFCTMNIDLSLKSIIRKIPILEINKLAY